jgi:hypothetical protein
VQTLLNAVSFQFASVAGEGRNRTWQIQLGSGTNFGENTAQHSGQSKPTCCQLGNEFFAFSKCKILILDSNRGGPSGHISRLEEAEPFFQIGLVGRIDFAW